MSESFEATTQYDDLKGTNAFDGHSGPPLSDLAKRSEMPEEYFPVGFELFRLNPNDLGKIPFGLFAVKITEAGDSMEKIISFANSSGELPVYRFDGELELTDFPVLFKRIDIKALSKSIPAYKVSIRRP